jgi:teichuronic acid biosynthesis glycosyltransferase TuaC
MHLLVVAINFPSPENPYPGNFIGQQVLALAERVERITVLSPVPTMPRFTSKLRRFAAKITLPEHYVLVPNRCEVLFPRYLKSPGNLLLSWTTAQWCRLVDQTIAQFAETFPVSIIHAHTGSVSSWAAFHAAERYKIPCAVTYHGSEVHTVLAGRQKGWKLCRDSFRAADLNLPVGRSLEEILRSVVQPTGRCETVFLGVERHRFFPAAELPLQQQVLYVGRIEAAKGVFNLLQAWVKVLIHSPDALLTMIGEDHNKGLFSQQARSLGLSHSISLKGPLPSPRVADMMRESRLFCLPSYNEGTPVCVMESLSCGLPVVATRVGGIPDIVAHGTTGLLVEKGDIQGLADALVSLLRDPSRCIRMGKAAQEFSDTHLDIRKTADRLVELYRETIRIHSTTLGAQAVHTKSSSTVGNSTESNPGSLGAL